MASAALAFLLSNIDNYLIEQSPEFVIQMPSDDDDDDDDDVELKVEDKVDRVPPLFRSKQSHQHAYDPVIVSMGPYHHGKQEYHHAEAFKQESVKAFLSWNPKDKLYYQKTILDNIEKLKSCYEKLDDELKDEDLATLIFSDACFFIYYVKNYTMNSSSHSNKLDIFYKYFGPARIKFIFRDLLLVENQIPLWVIQLLLQSRGDQYWNTLLGQFMSSVIPGVNSTTLPWTNNNNMPFHFLGAYYQALRAHIPVSLNLDSETPTGEINPQNFNTFRFCSITNLKSKGISLKLSELTEGQDVIRFDSHTFNGKLHLPRLFFSSNYFVLYSNLIAYEMSPTSNTDFFVSSLVNFLKSLIDGPDDVKILREKGILFNDMVSDDEVVKVIKDLDSFGVENGGAFSKVRDSIETHCCSKGKTWVAELFHTYLESPWNAIALLAAILLVGLTIAQTYYAANPAS